MSPLAQLAGFKYKPLCELEYLQDLILRHQLFFPRAKQLNDPREAKPPLLRLDAPTIARLIKRRFFKGKPWMSLDERTYHANKIDQFAFEDPEQAFNGMREYLYQLFDEYRIFSMSKRWDNLAMWAWYAANHTGYCLEFARIGLFEFADDVIYDNAGEVDISDQSQLEFNWFYRKSPDWRSEEEVRVVLPNQLVFPNQLKDGQLLTIEPQVLSRLILGARTPDIESKQIREWAEARTPPLTVVQARFDKNLQKLVVDAQSSTD